MGTFGRATSPSMWLHDAVCCGMSAGVQPIRLCGGAGGGGGGQCGGGGLTRHGGSGFGERSFRFGEAGAFEM